MRYKIPQYRGITGTFEVPGRLFFFFNDCGELWDDVAPVAMLIGGARIDSGIGVTGSWRSRRDEEI